MEPQKRRNETLSLKRKVSCLSLSPSEELCKDQLKLFKRHDDNFIKNEERITLNFNSVQGIMGLQNRFEMQKPSLFTTSFVNDPPMFGLQNTEPSMVRQGTYLQNSSIKPYSSMFSGSNHDSFYQYSGYAPNNLAKINLLSGNNQEFGMSCHNDTSYRGHNDQKLNMNQSWQPLIPSKKEEAVLIRTASLKPIYVDDAKMQRMTGMFEE